MRILEKVLRQAGRESQVTQFAFRQEIFVYQTGYIHRSKERTDNTDNQGRSESADRSGSEIEQDDTGND